MRNLKAKLAIGIPVILTVIVGGWMFIYNIQITDTGKQAENALNAQYVNNQNILSDCLVKIEEAANITGEQSEQFQQAMRDAIMGRYEDKGVSQGDMFSAIVESYPDLSSLSEAYERVHNIAVGCRSDYRDVQSKLLDMLREYDTFRTGSTIRTWFGSDTEFPSNNLVAQIGSDRSRTGQAALDQMWTIVLVSEATEATESGELEPLDPFAESSESPASEASPTSD